MALEPVATRVMACDGTAKYTYRVGGSVEKVEITAIDAPEITFQNYQHAAVPEGYIDPKSDGECNFGLDFIASKLYEDIFGKSFFTRGGESVGLFSDINENNYYQNVKYDIEYRPAGYFEEG